MLNVTLTVDGREFVCSARQANAIQTFIEAKKGGFARIKNYKSTSGRITPEVADITALTRISMDKLYERKIKALEAITFDQVAAHVANHPNKLSTLSTDALRELFEDRRREEIDSLTQTLVGDRSDARRQAHDTYYAHIDTGVKVHFKTTKVGKSTALVVLENGLPIVESIMLTYIPISKTVLTEGEYKPVNSGTSVLMSNVFNSLLPRSVKIRTASLKEDNFSEVIIDGEAIVPNDIAGLYT